MQNRELDVCPACGRKSRAKQACIMCGFWAPNADEIAAACQRIRADLRAKHGVGWAPTEDPTLNRRHNER